MILSTTLYLDETHIELQQVGTQLRPRLTLPHRIKIELQVLSLATKELVHIRLAVIIHQKLHHHFQFLKNPRVEGNILQNQKQLYLDLLKGHGKTLGRNSRYL